jgi:hypothetical protein
MTFIEMMRETGMDPQSIKVGNYVLFERNDLSFRIGQVRWLDDKWLDGGTSDILIAYDSPAHTGVAVHLISRYYVLANGPREEIHRLQRHLALLTEQRRQSIAKAEEDVGAMADRLRAQLRQEIKTFRRMAAGK